MMEEKVTICNQLGMHARAAAVFAKTAGTFPCEVEVIKDHMQVNGKSIMELLTLAASQGSEITIRASGPEEHSAIQSLSSLVNQGFGEDR